MIRVLVADDQPVVRSGLQMILQAQEDIDVVAEASDGEEALRLTRRCDPDVVLMDIRMPLLDGIATTRRLREAGSRCRVVVLTTYDPDRYVFDALRAGASGFLLKSDEPGRLVGAVRGVHAGESLFTPAVTRRLVERYVESPPPDVARGDLGGLTDRELDVLRELAAGASNAEIAARLFIGEGTVKTHVARILAKNGIRDRVQAVILAYESGLVRPGSAVVRTAGIEPRPG